MKYPILILAAFLLPALAPAAADAPVAELNARDGLPHVAAKIAGNGNIRVAFLGGSITVANGWRVHSLDILRRAFPKAKFSEIFAAVSGTGSDYGACRVQRDVLDKNPDLVLVEFAVNDNGVPSDQVIARMEGIVRQIRAKRPQADICFIYTLAEAQLATLQDGRCQPSAAAMENVAAHYGIPSIHLGVEVARRATAGTLVFSAPASVKADTNGNDPEGRIIFTRDKIHPTPAGHRVYAATLERTLPALIKSSAPVVTASAMPAPLHAGNWERASLILFPATAQSSAWRKLPASDAVAQQAGQMAPPIWATFTPGATVEFSFKGTRFGIIGLKGSDNGKFRCTIDGNLIATDTLFDSFSTPGRHPLKPWFYPEPLADADHHVRIELLADKIDKTAIMKKTGTPITDAAPYDPHGLYLCGLLIVGEERAVPILK